MTIPRRKKGEESGRQKNIFLNNDTRRSAIKSPQFKFETLRPKHLSPKSHNRIFLIILLWALIIPSWLPSSGSWDLVTFSIPLNVYVTSTNFGYDKVARNPCLRDSLLIEWYLAAFETQLSKFSFARIFYWDSIERNIPRYLGRDFFIFS